MRTSFFTNLFSGFAIINIAVLLIVAIAFFLTQEGIIRAGFEQKVKQQEDRFEKSEQRYYSLVEHASDAIYVIDKSRDFIHVNESLCKMTATRGESY